MKNKPDTEEIDVFDAISQFLNNLFVKPRRVLRVGKYLVTVRQGILILLFLYILLFGYLLYYFMTGQIFFTQNRSNINTTPSAAITPNAPILTSQDISDLQQKLADLEAEIAQIKTSGQSEQLDSLEDELREIRLTITGDPEKALTLQRMDFEISKLGSRIDTLDELTKWIFGITLTLALAVLSVVIAAIIKISYGSGRSTVKDRDND